MRSNGIFLLLLGLFLGACNFNTNLRTIQENDEEGNTIRYTVSKESGQKEGTYSFTNAEGIIQETANYLADELDGIRVLFYEDQDTMIMETHKAGQYHGVYKSFYPEGGLKIEGTYTKNKMEGWWYKYYPSGELMEQVTFVDNQENGPFIEFHKNGNPSVKGNYINGDNEQGEILFYDESGVHYRTMRCDTGLCRTIWRLSEPEN